MTTETQQLPEMVLNAPPEGFRYDKKKDGWKLESDCGPVVGEPTLYLEEFLCEGESYVKGDVMVARAKEMPGLPAGQMHAERLLEQADQIPVEWRKFVLVFTDTVWLRPFGLRFVAFLYWDGGGWCLRFGWLGGDFRSDYRVVRLRPDAEGGGESK